MYLANIQNGKEQKIYQISSIDSNIHGIRWNEQLTSLKKFGRCIFSSQKCSCPRSLRSLKNIAIWQIDDLSLQLFHSYHFNRQLTKSRTLTSWRQCLSAPIIWTECFRAETKPAQLIAYQRMLD